MLVVRGEHPCDRARGRQRCAELHDQRFADGREVQTVLREDLRGKSLLVTQQSEQQMLDSNVRVKQPAGFLGGVFEHALGGLAEWYFHGGVRQGDRRPARS